MNYAIAVKDGAVTGTYAGTAPTKAPWIAVTMAQHRAAQKAGATWSGTEIVVPTPATPTSTQLLAAQARALLAGGLSITSQETPALNGTYAANQSALQALHGVQIFVQTTGRLPGASGTYTVTDKAGVAHTFPTYAQFSAFFVALADFAASCRAVAMAGTGSLPPASATIP